MINNKIENTFGTIGVIVGIVLLLAGIYVCFYSWIGVTTIIVGWFLTFSYTNTSIDLDNKKARFSNKLFGLIIIGYWVDIKEDMRVEIRPHNIKSNSKTSKSEAYKIMLIDKNGNEIMPLKKLQNKQEAEIEIKKEIYNLD